MNELFGSTGWANPVALASELGPLVSEDNEEAPKESQPKKRKFDCIFEDYRKDMVKYREERAKVKLENFAKLLELKKKQHEEKMELLRQLLVSNNRPGSSNK